MRPVKKGDVVRVTEDTWVDGRYEFYARPEPVLIFGGALGLVVGVDGNQAEVSIASGDDDDPYWIPFDKLAIHPVRTFNPPELKDFSSPEAWGNAYWAARQDFIAAGHSERYETNCAAVDPEDGTPYVFQVQQSSDGSASGYGLPRFDDVEAAIAYLEAAPFPGLVQRYVAPAEGRRMWLTAGIAYEKHAGERDYWKARNLMPDQAHWHPDRGQAGHLATPCPYCYQKESS